MTNLFLCFTSFDLNSSFFLERSGFLVRCEKSRKHQISALCLFILKFSISRDMVLDKVKVGENFFGGINI